VKREKIMAKSAAERQAEFRAKSKGKFKRLDLLLPVKVFNTLHLNAKNSGLSKAAYIDWLLKGNSTSKQSKEAIHQLSNGSSYDGNAKYFRKEVESITGISEANRSRFADNLKRAYEISGIRHTKHGRLYSDEDRLFICQWLIDNP